MHKKQECYDLIAECIVLHGFKVRYYHEMVSPDQTPHMDPRVGEGDEAHDNMFVLKMDRRLGEEKGSIKLLFSGCARMSGGRHDSATLMRMARELRDGAKLVKALNELELKYIDPEYKNTDAWRKKYL